MQLKRKALKAPLGKRVDDIHRPPTRFERFREWLEDLPKIRLYVTLVVVCWAALTLLIGFDTRAPIERVISQGILERGDLAQLERSRLLGDWNPWLALLGVALVVAAEMGMAWYFLERFGRRVLKTNAAIRVVLAASLMILFTALARFFIQLDFDAYLTPLAGLSIIGTMLLGPRLMFLMVVITSVNVGIMSGNDFLLTAALLLGSGFAIYTVIRADSRKRLLKAGLIVATVMAVLTFAVSLIGGGGIRDAAWMGVVGMGNGLLSLMLAMVLLPLLEDAFNILTPMKLLELSDPGNQLLTKLLQKAPGTFTHSMQVGNLADHAAERIGADSLLVRVGAYYHDVGKMEHPAYFIENQIARVSPHAGLTPALSAKVIKRHVKDGLEIGRAWGLPQEVLDLIAEHHGTTRIEFFYRKALETDKNVNEADFRYPGGRPRRKEAGILMLADSVEATVKSMPKPTPKRIEDMISDTIRRKLEDGQFDECELTMGEIHRVGDALREAIIGFLGPRIEYPEPPDEPRPQKVPSDLASPNGAAGATKKPPTPAQPTGAKTKAAPASDGAANGGKPGRPAPRASGEDA